MEKEPPPPYTISQEHQKVPNEKFPIEPTEPHDPKKTYLFFNEDVHMTEDYIAIQWYYFPTAGQKKIKYEDISKVSLGYISDLSAFDTKEWGMGLNDIWWHCDMERMGRLRYILLQLHNSMFRVGITTDDNQINQIYQLIQKQMRSHQKEKS